MVVVTDVSFGFYGSHVWHDSEGYFGDSRSFLFSFKSGAFEAYHATGANEHYQNGNPDTIQIGFDDFGLVLVSDSTKNTQTMRLPLTVLIL